MYYLNMGCFQPPSASVALKALMDARKERLRKRQDTRGLDELWPDILVFPHIPHIRVWQLCSRVALCWACAVTAGLVVFH